MAEQVPASLPVEFVERVVYTMVDAGTIRPQLAAAVEFESHLDEARVARAVRLLADAEPVLSLPLRRRGSTPSVGPCRGPRRAAADGRARVIRLPV